MKRFGKIIVFLLVFSLGISMIGVANDTSQIDNNSSHQVNEAFTGYTKDTSGDPAIVVNGISTVEMEKDLLDAVDVMTEKSYVYIKLTTDKYMMSVTHRPEGSNCKRQLSDFIEGLFDLVNDDTINDLENNVPKNEEVIANSQFNIYDEERTNLGGYIKITQNTVKLYTKKYGEIMLAVKDSSIFVDYLAEQSKSKLTAFSAEIYDANTPNIKGDIEDFMHTDIVEFDFVLPEDSDNSLTKEVAKPGETVSAVVDQYRKNRRYVHVLTLSGSLGEVSFWTEYQNMQLEESLDLYSDNLPIVFNDQDRFENGNRGYYPVGKTKDSYPVQIRFNSGKLYSVTFAEDIECTNISHTSLVEDSSMEDKYGDKDKEAMIEQLEKDMQNGAKEQDLERYVTEMRTFEEDGSEGFDFYVSFLAQADIDIPASASTPDWYDKLGDNVKATIVGITQTWAGKDRRNYTMIKFTGDDDSIWFDMSMITPSAAIGEEDCYVETIYSSLISFDGFQKIQNTIEYDTTSTVLNFDNFENKKLTSVVFEIGKKKVEISADKIKHIGGGKIAYEKLW